MRRFACVLATVFACSASTTAGGWPHELPSGEETPRRSLRELEFIATEDTPSEVGHLGKWLESVSIPVPEIESSPVTGGNCSGLTVGSVKTNSRGSQGTVDLSFALDGLGMHCKIMVRDATLVTEFSFERSEMKLGLLIEPLRSKGGEIQLPLGPVSVTDCSLDLHITELDFSGSSALSEGLHDLQSEIASVVQREAPELICDGLKDALSNMAETVDPKVKKALDILASARLQEVGRQMKQEEVAMFAYPLNGKEGNLEGTEVGLVDWGTYPVLPFVNSLMEDRAHIIILAALGAGLHLPLPRGIAVWNASNALYSWSLALDSLGVRGLEQLGGGLQLGGRRELLDASVYLDEVLVTVDVGTSVESLLPKQGRWSDSMTFSLGLKNVSLAMQMLAAVSRARLDALHADQLQQLGCLANCASGGSGRAGGYNSSVALMSLTASATPTVGANANGSLESDFAVMIQTVGDAFLTASAPSMDAVLLGASALARDKVNSEISRYLDTQPTCADSKVFKGPGSLVTSALLWTAVFLPTFAAAFTLGSGSVRILSSGKQPEALSSRESKRVRGEPPHGEAPAEVVGRGGCLGGHPVVPTFLSNVFPFFAFGTVLLFMYSNMEPGIDVNVYIEADGHTVKIGPAFSFSLWNSTTDAIRAGAFLLAFMIFNFSGVWPIVKLLLLIFAWVAPEARLSANRRSRLLHFLDTYGKYSLVDTWMAIIGDSCYGIRWASPDGERRLTVMAENHFSFLMFMVASVTSIALGQIASEFDRLSKEWDHKATIEMEDHVEAELTGQTEDLGAPRPLYSFAPRRTATALAVGLPVTAGIIVLGFYATSYELVLSGLLAHAVLDEPDLNRPMSTAVLAGEITETGLGVNLVIQVVFVLFAAVFPLALLSSLALLWLMPLQHGMQRALLLLCRGLGAWIALDVFVLAVLVAHFEYGTVANFMTYQDSLSAMCTAITEFLQVDCFSISYEILPGFAVLAAAGVLSMVVPWLAIDACQEALERREIEGQPFFSEASNSFTHTLSDEGHDSSNCVVS